MDLTGFHPATFETEEVADFEALRRAVDRFRSGRRGFAFRGHYVSEHSNHMQSLVTGLERVSKGIDDDSLRRAPEREAALIREFARRAHHYLADVPVDGNYYEWLALMQHHGAPTRLLDWTYSPYVAAHFALSHALRVPGARLAIWAVNMEWCRKASEAVCREAGKPAVLLARRPLRRDLEPGASDLLLSGTLPPSVWPVNPFRLNERLTIQKGLFLAPADIRVPFAANLSALSAHDVRANVTCFTLPRAAADGIGQILEAANVTDTTLFPGMDGFAKSLWRSARYLNTDGIRLTDIF